MNSRSLILGCALVVFGVPLPLHADPITIDSSTRAIVNSAGVGFLSTGTTTLYNQDQLSNTIGVNNPDLGTAMSSALLHSSISTTSFSGQGATSTSHSSTVVQSGAYSQSSYVVAFTLSQPLAYFFRGAFDLAPADATDRSNWQANLWIQPAAANQQNVFNETGVASGSFISSGTLLPGSYGFAVELVSNSFDVGTGSTSGASNFVLELSQPGAPTPTPEPASLLLLGSGVVGLIGRRKLSALKPR